MNRPPDPGTSVPEGDPWAAFGYLVAGVGLYGALGWGLSIWLHADFWIPIGILVGLGFGMYMVFARYRLREPDIESDSPDSMQDTVDAADVPETDSAARTQRPDSNDRGETA